MNAERLLALYERIADAPDAVVRLRRFVLDLAVRGKLVEQNSDDEPAPDLMNRTQRSRKCRRKFASVDEQAMEIPLPPIPSSWIWATVDSISDDFENAITDGPFGSNLKTAHYISRPGFRVIRLQNIGSGEFRDEHRSFIEHEQFALLKKHHVNSGDLVVAGLVDPRVRCCEVPANIGPALVKADCYRLAVHPNLSARFVRNYLNSELAQQFASIHHHGMTLTRIGLGNFRHIPVPVPPAREQHRIVAKVDELMALCDRLEAARAQREATRDRLATASLARLNAPDPDTFRDDARFALDALPVLTTRADQIKQLRQSILNLAVRGKLVPQDPRDEPTSVLLERIEEDKALRSTAKLGKLSAIRMISEDAFPYLRPIGWAFVRFGDIVVSRDGERIPVSKEERNGRTKVFDYYGASGVIDKIDSYLFDKPLLLIGEDGANLVNRSTPIAFIARGKYWVNNHAHVLDSLSEGFLR